MYPGTDPASVVSKREARAFLVGAYVALISYAAEGFTLTAVRLPTSSRFPLAVLPSGVPLLVGGLCCWFCGVDVALRWQGSSLLDRSRWRGPIGFVPRFPPNLWRVMTPTFIRSASRRAGWAETRVLYGLGILVAIGTSALICYLASTL